MKDSKIQIWICVRPEPDTNPTKEYSVDMLLTREAYDVYTKAKNLIDGVGPLFTQAFHDCMKKYEEERK